MQRLEIIVISLMGLGIILGGCGKENNSGQSNLAPAPDFTLKTLDGKTISLSNVKGKVVLLDFWASWCAPCRKELPHIQKLANEFRDKGLIIYGINDEPIDKAIEFLKKNNYSLTVLHDDNTVAHLYQVTGFPTIVFIDKDGRLVETIVGYEEEAVLREKIERLLK